MAFTRSGASGSITMSDHSGQTRTVRIPYPDLTDTDVTVTSAMIYGALTALVPLIEAVSGMVAVGLSVSDNYYDDAADPQTATRSAAQVGTLSFHNLRQGKTNVSVPGFLETKLITTGVPQLDDQQIINLDDADVTALSTALVTGYDTGDGILKPGVDDNGYITSVYSGNFRYVNSQTKRISRG